MGANFIKVNGQLFPIGGGGGTSGVSSVNGRTGAVTLSKADVDLNNVPNVTTDNQTPTFTQASSRANLVSGTDTLAAIMGKIMKWFADLKDLAFIAKDGTSSTKYLRGDGTWQTFPTIPTVNNGTLKIQKNGTDITGATFTANQSGDTTVDITVPTTADDVNAVKYDGNLTSLGTATPAAATKTYFDNNVANNKVEVAYNTSGDEYTILFSRGGSAQYGNILKYGYADKYLRILRKKANTWQSTDWEKISAGYADTAGSINWGNITGTLSSQVDLQNELNNKQAKLVSGTNIKTINGQSVLGSGNITISAGGATWGNIGGTLTDQTDLWLEIEPRIKLNTEYTDPFTNNTLKISEGHVEISASPSSVNKARLYWNRLTFEHTVSSTTTSCEYWETGVKLGKTSNGTTTMVYLGDTVLWTNPSPSASMGATTITLSEDVTHFDYIMIMSASTSQPDRIYDNKIMPAVVGASVTSFMSTDVNRRRTVTIATSTTLTTTRTDKWASYGGSSSNSSSDDKFLVVKKVIGFKFHN